MTSAQELNRLHTEFYVRTTWDSAGTPHTAPPAPVTSYRPDGMGGMERVTGVINAPATKEDRRPK